MPNPLRPISPILELLGKEIKILPATGGAVEVYRQPVKIIFPKPAFKQQEF